MKVEEIKPRASEGDVIELEGKVSFAQKPNSNDFEGTTVWSQFVVLKDDTGEQGCWLKLDSPEDKVAKGTSIKIKGKLGEEYEDKKGVMKRSINNCDFEVMGKEQGPAQSSGSSAKGNDNDRDDYWAKKFEWDKKVHFSIVRECAIKAVTELAKVDPSKGNFLIKVNTEKDFFEFAEKIEDYICKRITSEDIIATLGGEIVGTLEDGRPEVKTGTKEERIEKASEAVGETRFRPASTLQKNKIFGYRDKEGWKKGMIESRFITKEEIREIGSPEKLSVEKASEKLSWWWGIGDEVGERAKREIDKQDEEPIKKHLEKEEPLIKGDKTSLMKDILVEEVYALRRENFLNDDEKFWDEMGYNPIIEELSEKELTKLKEVLQHYHPKDWNGEEK